MQSECLSEYCDLSGLDAPLIKYTNEPFCGGGAAGCAPVEDGIRVVYIDPDYAYAGPDQYPAYVDSPLNVELFMHEFLHHFTGFCFGDGSHENGWFNDSPCPQDLWREPSLWQ